MKITSSFGLWLWALLIPAQAMEMLTKQDLALENRTAGALLTAQTVQVSAEAEGEAIDLMDEVTVTGTRRAVRQRENSTTVYVITREEIERKGASSVGEAIRGVPGVQTNLFGAGADVHGNYFVRGLPNSGLGILVDGRLITNLNQEHFDLADLPVENVNRIEVLTGSGATLYGSNAVGGVINVITRQPTQALEGSIKAEFGSYGYSNYVANYGGKLDKLAYHLGYRQFDASNDYYYQVNRASRTFTGFRPNGQVSSRFYDLNLSYDMDDRTRLRLDAYTSNVAKGIAPFSITDPNFPLVDPTTGESQFELTRLTNRNFGVALTLDSKLGQGQDSNLQIVTAFDDTKLTETSSIDPTDQGSFTNISAFNFQVRHDWQFNPTNNITYGFDYIHESGTSGERAAGGIFNFDSTAGRPAFFGLYTWKVTPQLIVNTGARATFPDPLTTAGFKRTFPTSFDPSVGLRWQITPTLALRSNYQSVYRTPNFNDLFGRTTHIGNPFLDPQTGTSFDVGVDWQTGSNSLLRVTYFHSDIRNLVDYLLVRNSCAANDIDPNSPECTDEFNNDPKTNAQRFRVGYPQVSSSGWEAAYTWQAAPRWGLFGTLTLTDSRVVQPPDALGVDDQLRQIGQINSSDEGNYKVDVGERNALVQTQYPLVPYSTARLGINYEEPNGLQVSLFANISGKRSVDVNHVGPFDTTQAARLAPGTLISGYTTLDLSARVPLTPGLLLNAYVDNLLGTYYERSYGNPAPGFNFRVGLTSRF